MNTLGRIKAMLCLIANTFQNIGAIISIVFIILFIIGLVVNFYSSLIAGGITFGVGLLLIGIIIDRVINYKLR